MNDVTTFDHGHMLGRQPIHQDRPIGVVEGRVLCCGKQLHRHRTCLHKRLEVPTLGSQESCDPFEIEPQPILNRVRPDATTLGSVPAAQGRSPPDPPERPVRLLYARGGVAELRRPSKTRRILESRHLPG